MLSRALFVLPVAVAAVATKIPGCTSEEICVDGINDCGVPWGG